MLFSVAKFCSRDLGCRPRSTVLNLAFQLHSWAVKQIFVTEIQLSHEKPVTRMHLLQWNLDNSNCRGPPKKVWVVKSLSYELCSPFALDMWPKGNLVALTTVYLFELWLKIRDMPRKLSLARQGPWNLVWLWVKRVIELSEAELSEFHSTYNLNLLTFSDRWFQLWVSGWLYPDWWWWKLSWYKRMQGGSQHVCWWWMYQFWWLLRVFVSWRLQGI